MNIDTINGYLHPKSVSSKNDLKRLQIEDDHVYLWLFSEEQPISTTNYFTELLSLDEQLRAKRYRFMLDRRRFINRRGLLRTILGMILGISPKEIDFRYSFYGKPSIESCPRLFFNLSFSDRLAVIAISNNREVGIDIERNRSLPDIRQIAKQYFSPEEFAQWQSGDDHQRIESFYRVWTCKEALVKALGVGLSLPLNNIEITFGVDDISHLMFRDYSTEISQWRLFPLDIVAGYSACLAVDGRNFPLNDRYVKPLQKVPLQIANQAVKVALTEFF